MTKPHATDSIICRLWSIVWGLQFIECEACGLKPPLNGFLDRFRLYRALALHLEICSGDTISADDALRYLTRDLLARLEATAPAGSGFAADILPELRQVADVIQWLVDSGRGTALLAALSGVIREDDLLELAACGCNTCGRGRG